MKKLKHLFNNFYTSPILKVGGHLVEIKMNHFENKKILVVGGAGFVGSNLTKKLLQLNAAHVIVVDNLLSADVSQIPIHSNLEFIHESIT